MSSSLDMSLDDLIKKNKKVGGGRSFRGQRRGVSGPGPTRRFPSGSGNRAEPYAMGKASNRAWKNALFPDQMGAFPAPAATAFAIETGIKLYISNLDYGVSSEDVKELFSEVGDLKRYLIHYDRSGRSKGTAEVVFSRRESALAAVKRYNNVQLDGKPMNIEIVTNVAKPAALPLTANVGFGNSNSIPRSGRGRGGLTGRAPRGGGGGHRGDRGRGRGRDDLKSATDLDSNWTSTIQKQCKSTESSYLAALGYQACLLDGCLFDNRSTRRVVGREDSCNLGLEFILFYAP